MNNLISVIVPIYNVEKYLSQCIDSIINQSYLNLEIILIDDGSTDSSGLMCDSYKLIDDRIIVIHTENNGQGAARNIGIQNAKGQYITFVDSDDYIENDMIMKLYSNMLASKSDISVCGICAVSGKSKTYNLLKSDEKYITFSRDEAISMLLDDIGFTCSVWNKLFKREVIGDIRLEEGKVYEDIVPMYEWFRNADKISYTPIPLYNYRFRKDSTTKAAFLEYNADLLESINAFRKKYESDYPDSLTRIMPGYISYGIHFINKNLSYNDIKEFVVDFKKICSRYWKDFRKSDRIRKIKKKSVFAFRVCPLWLYSFCHSLAKKITNKLLN